MWDVVGPSFKKYPAQEKVARAMTNLGLSVREGNVYCGNIELSVSAMSRSLGVDRRIITNTVKTISSNPKLKQVFARLEPTSALRNVAPYMGWSVIEIILSDSSRPGLLGKIATEIGKKGVSIRQAIGEDPQFSEGKLFIITETEIPPDAIVNIRKIPGVVKVVI